MNHTIIVSPKRDRDARAAPTIYDARLIGDAGILCSSEAPLVNAARILLKSEQAMPNDTITMRHKGSDTVALRAKVGRAAMLSVEDGDRRPIQFVRWKPLDVAAVTARKLPKARGGAKPPGAHPKATSAGTARDQPGGPA
jgi:hypothetical protein